MKIELDQSRSFQKVVTEHWKICSLSTPVGLGNKDDGSTTKI